MVEDNAARAGTESKSDWNWVVLFLVLGVAGAATAYRFFFRAFPEASIDLRLPKEEIARRSTHFLQGRGLSTEGYHQLTTFDFDEQAKTYLERELGLEEANRWMSTRVKIWRWKTRLFKPPQKEELIVWRTPAGELAGFEHKVDENLAGAKLAKDEAQRIAEVFLRAEIGLDLDRYKPVTDELQTRPNRLDYTFTWEEKDLKLRDATARISVTVEGDQVGSFNEFLKIPEQWTRDYQRLRSRNNLLSSIATALYVLLLLVAVAVVVKSARRKQVRWKGVVAIAAVVASLYTIFLWNLFPLQIERFPTNIPYDTLVVFWAVVAVLNGLLVGLYVLLLAAPGETLYRELSPNRVSLNRLFTFSGLRSREFFTSTLIGYGMAGMHIGLVVLFYVWARRYGAWAPLEVKYDNAISTPLPWIYPLTIAAFAATSEEFGFRLFAIPLLLRWLKSRWLAVIIPAFLWGFLHSNYPNQPAWIRGVEVGAIGIVAGWVFLRFGILATLVWHYTVDAVLIGLFLLRSENLTFRIAGAIVGDAVLLPLIIGVVFLVESRGFLRDENMLNRAPEEAPAPAAAVEAPPEVTAAQAAVAEPAPAVAAAFAFISPKRMQLLALAGAAGLVALLLVKTPYAGDEIKIQATAAQAESTAVNYLRRRGVSPDRFRRVTSFEDHIPGPAAEYLRENAGATALARIYHEQVPSVFWRTRFFRPLEKEEYQVWVDPEGRVARYAHLLDEKAPGARLEKPDALARAETFLTHRPAQGAGQQSASALRWSGGVAGRPVALAGYQLMQQSLERREARNDHTVEWEAKAKLLGEATHRVTVEVIGEEATGPRHWIKIPEEWERRHTRLTVFSIFPAALITVMAIVALVLFAKALARTTIHWRLHLFLGGVGAGLQLLRSVNGIPGWAVNYKTSEPWASSMTMNVAFSLIIAVGTFIGLAALAAVAEVLLAERFGTSTGAERGSAAVAAKGASLDVADQRSALVWSLALRPANGYQRARALLEGLVAGVAAALVLGGVRALADAALERVPSPVRSLSTGLPNYPVSFWPSLAVFLEALIRSLWVTLLLAAIAGLLLRLFRSRTVLIPAIAAGTALLAAGPALNGVQFAKNWVATLISVAVVGAVVAVLRFNLTSYLVLGVVGTGALSVASLWRHPAFEGIALQSALGLGLLVLLIILWARQEATQ